MSALDEQSNFFRMFFWLLGIWFFGIGFVHAAQGNEKDSGTGTLLINAHGTEIEITNILPTPWDTDGRLVEFTPPIGPQTISHAGLTWFAEATDSGVLVFLGNKGPEPLNNDGRKTCYWGCGPTTPISARKHYCKVCGR